MSFHRDYDTLIHWLDEWRHIWRQIWNKDISIGRVKLTLKGVQKFVKKIIRYMMTVNGQNG